MYIPFDMHLYYLYFSNDSVRTLSLENNPYIHDMQNILNLEVDVFCVPYKKKALPLNGKEYADALIINDHFFSKEKYKSRRCKRP